MAGIEWFLLAGLLGGLIKGIHDNNGFVALPRVDQTNGLYLGFVLNVIIGLVAGYYVYYTDPTIAPWLAFTTGLTGSAIIETLADKSGITNK